MLHAIYTTSYSSIDLLYMWFKAFSLMYVTWYRFSLCTEVVPRIVYCINFFGWKYCISAVSKNILKYFVDNLTVFIKDNCIGKIQVEKDILQTTLLLVLWDTVWVTEISFLFYVVSHLPVFQVHIFLIRVGKRSAINSKLQSQVKNFIMSLKPPPSGPKWLFWSFKQKGCGFLMWQHSSRFQIKDQNGKQKLKTCSNFSYWNYVVFWRW